jgi:hypothetical protein
VVPRSSLAGLIRKFQDLRPKKLWPAEVKASPAISLGPRALKVERKVLKDYESNLAPVASWGASFFLLPSSFEDGST